MTSNSIQIRRATLADAAGLAEFAAQAFSDSFAEDNTPENMADYLAASFSPEIQSQEIADPRCIFLLAEIEDSLVGYVQLRSSEPEDVIRDPRPIELVRIYAHRDWIGRGIGSALMQASLNEARHLGYETMWLGVWEHNPRAQAFYTQWGFVKVGEHNFQLGQEPQTDWLMQRSLAD